MAKHRLPEDHPAYQTRSEALKKWLRRYFSTRQFTIRYR